MSWTLSLNNNRKEKKIINCFKVLYKVRLFCKYLKYFTNVDCVYLNLFC